MSMYLCVFDDEDEIEGVAVGYYSDFERLRSTISKKLECGFWGSRFPMLQNHSDCEGEWSVENVGRLKSEIGVIASELTKLPPDGLPDGWQRDVARLQGLNPRSLAECFFDVDGEPLFERLGRLCDVEIERQCPILFQ